MNFAACPVISDREGEAPAEPFLCVIDRYLIDRHLVTGIEHRFDPTGCDPWALG